MRPSTSDGSTTNTEQVVAVSFQEEAVGKLISQTKKRYWWTILVGRQSYEICLSASRMSGRKRITVNGQMQFEEVSPLARLTTFMHSWNLRDHSLSIIPTWAVKETVYRSFELSIDGIPFGHLFEGARPGACMSGTPALKIVIKIFSAKGLRAADWNGSSDPYCVCEIPGKRGSKIQTAVINKTLAPKWNHEHTIADYTPGDPLYFKVMDKDVWPKTDDLLGKATLASEQFFPWGFDGWLELQGEGQHKGLPPMLKIRIAISGTPQEERLREMFDRCDANKDGSINKRELIKILRVDQEVASFFQLPQNIRQEDGSRDSMERIFQEMDKSGSREVSWEEFRTFFSRRPDLARSMPPTPETRARTPRDGSTSPRAGSAGSSPGSAPRTPTAVSPSISLLQRMSMSPPVVLALPGDASTGDSRRPPDSADPGIGLLEVRPKQTSTRRRAAQKARSVSPISGHAEGAGDVCGFVDGADPWGSSFQSFGAFPSTPAYGGWPGSMDSEPSAKEERGFSTAFDESCIAAFHDLSQWGATDSPTTGDEGSPFHAPPSPAMPSNVAAADASPAACNVLASSGSTSGHHQPRRVQPEMSSLNIGQGSAVEKSAKLVDPWGYAYSPRSRPATPREQRPVFNTSGPSPSLTSTTVELVDPWGNKYSPVPRYATPCQ